MSLFKCFLLAVATAITIPSLVVLFAWVYHPYAPLVFGAGLMVTLLTGFIYDVKKKD